jgi:hypothetical protein
MFDEESSSPIGLSDGCIAKRVVETEHPRDKSHDPFAHYLLLRREAAAGDGKVLSNER